MGEGRTGEPQTNQRLTVAQAAASLGITEGAVRSRIKRGTLPTAREGGTVFVLLGGSTPQTNQAPNIGVPSDQSELVEELRDRVRYLERRLDEEREARTEERRRHDTLMAQLTSRIPQIEAPSQEPHTESPGAPRPPDQQTPSEASEAPQMHTVGGVPREGDTDSPDHHTPSERERPWWRRLFGE